MNESSLQNTPGLLATVVASGTFHVANEVLYYYRKATSDVPENSLVGEGV